MLAHELRSRHCHRQDVLKLIAEPVGPSGLVEGGPGPDAAGQSLIEKPAVEEEVHRGIGCLDLDRAQHLIPVFLDLTERRLATERAVALDQGSSLLGIAALAQQKEHLRAFAGPELHVRPESGAGVQARSGLPR